MALKSSTHDSSPPDARYTQHGLSLSGAMLRALRKRGIYCNPAVSLEHQHLAKRYVLRGVESGGAVVDMGRACAFVAPDGQSLPWLQRIDSIGVNGRHAIFIAESLVRVEMLRTVRTCELAITLHTPSLISGRTRPVVFSRLLFRGQDGELPIDLWREEHRALLGEVAPVFYNRAGEIASLPLRFEEVIRRVAGAVCCVGCRHTHVGVAPSALPFGLRVR